MFPQAGEWGWDGLGTIQAHYTYGVLISVWLLHQLCLRSSAQIPEAGIPRSGTLGSKGVGRSAAWILSKLGTFGREGCRDRGWRQPEKSPTNLKRVHLAQL